MKIKLLAPVREREKKVKILGGRGNFWGQRKLGFGFDKNEGGERKPTLPFSDRKSVV